MFSNRLNALVRTSTKTLLVGAAVTQATKGGKRFLSAEEPRPEFRFGAIADVQYADVEDQHNFSGKDLRRYRGVLDCLAHAVRDWVEGPPLHFIADLGDIIDQQCESKGDSLLALARVLHEWKPIQVPVLRAVGNHELYNFSRAECAEIIPGIYPWYRSLNPAPGWRVLVLDSYELNVIERDAGDAGEDGFSFLSQHNPNDLRAPRGTVDLGVGLKGLQRRFLPMGGGIGSVQLDWLRDELCAASSADERVIVLIHVPLFPDATVPGALLWNYDEVLSMIRKAEEGTVALVLAGHYHKGGYAEDLASGTHHVTLPSPLHSSVDDSRAHCLVEVWSDHIEVLGRGLVPSRTLPLRHSARIGRKH